MPTWHGMAQPTGVDFLEGRACEPPAELGRAYSVLPVTHTRAGSSSRRTVWLYYARGCSDLGWGMGRTLLSVNREDLALRLMARLHATKEPSTLVGRSLAVAARRVAALAQDRFPGWAAKVVRAANSSRHTPSARYFAQERFNGGGPSLEALLIDAADGIIHRRGSQSGCHLTQLGDTLNTNAGARPLECAGSCAERAHALLHVFGAIGDEGRAMDAINVELLGSLCTMPDRALDSVILYQQTSGTTGRWATELWDTTAVCVARGVSIPRGPRGEPVGGPLWLNGSSCARTPPEEYRRCYACAGSELQRACRVADWRRVREAPHGVRAPA